MAKKKTRKFKAEVTQVLSLVINSLYSNKEIFLRELVSNASDALDKLRFEALSNSELTADDPNLRIRITADEEAGTVTIWDNGIGMTEDELITQLGTIAHSGSREFLQQIADGADVNIIGQFGVGFYSAYLVADRVEVITRKAGTDEAFRWTSDAQESFTVEPTERESRGTSVILHLGDEHREFALPYRLRQLVAKYSDFVGYPIEMQKMSYDEDEAAAEFEQVNEASALWRRPSDDITEEQHEEFYQHLSGDWEGPLAHTHFTVEGMQLFRGLLYIPKRQPWDLFEPNAKHGVRLYVKRVFIMDNAEELVPSWLRFVRGVVDSDDLPLNVSRELLQDSRAVRTMRKQVIKKTLDLLLDLAENRPDDYADFWANFGTVLKEGLHFDPDNREKLAKLVRFGTSESDTPIGLQTYVERMKEGQESIYYAIGESRLLLDGSPHLEALRKRGYEVLYLTDPIDSWAIEGLREFDDKKLVDAMNAELDLTDEETEEQESKTEELESLTQRFQEVLDDQVEEVRVSSRLAESPACLVVPEGGLAVYVERLLRAQRRGDVPPQKRILELNPGHPLVTAVQEIANRDGEAAADWIRLIYDQALLAEGSPIADPPRFARKLTELMETAARMQLD